MDPGQFYLTWTSFNGWSKLYSYPPGYSRNFHTWTVVWKFRYSVLYPFFCHFTRKKAYIPPFFCSLLETLGTNPCQTVCISSLISASVFQKIKWSQSPFLIPTSCKLFRKGIEYPYIFNSRTLHVDCAQMNFYIWGKYKCLKFLGFFHVFGYIYIYIKIILCPS